MTTLLVTGGAGYVGSHSVLQCRSLGWRVLVLDNLSTGHADFARLADRFVTGDITDAATVDKVLDSEAIDGILHCAARSLVPESMIDPLAYLDHNIKGAINLIRSSMSHRNVPIVFSSSAAVYGAADAVPVAEAQVCNPVNPYGFSKLAIERALGACHEAHGLPSVCLRYFNVAGADGNRRCGERHEPETHLIPTIIKAGLQGAGQAFTIFGDDYPTRDGTCVRDYIHVDDLAFAHARAFEYLWSGGSTDVFNLGSGAGLTVREVFDACVVELGLDIEVQVAKRRPGDPATLLADISKAARILGWAPTKSDVGTILGTAQRWHRHELASQRS